MKELSPHSQSYKFIFETTLIRCRKAHDSKQVIRGTFNAAFVVPKWYDGDLTVE
jgi:hypothetical protein